MGRSSFRPDLMDTACLVLRAIPALAIHNYENPFRDRTTFIFGVPRPAKVRLYVYNRSGELIQRLIDDRLDARLKDQRLVEVETAQAVVSRIGDWARLFAFFVAVPLGILVVVLTILGIRRYEDFVATVEATKKELAGQLEGIKAEFAAAAGAGKNARAEGDKLNQEIAEIRKTVDLTQAARLRSELDTLSRRVSGIESRFKIGGASTSLEASLTQALGRFADYMGRIGFDAKKSPATVTVDVGPVGGSPNSFYSLEDGKVVVDRGVGDLDTDPSMVLWPYAQHLMKVENETAIRAYDGLGGALSNGVPDYFVASYLGDPRIGKGFPGAKQGYIRNVDNNLEFSATVTEPHAVGEIWAGAFWKIRAAIGQSSADRLLYLFWKSIRQTDLTDASGASLARRLVAATEQVEGGKHADVVREILKARRLPL